MSGWVSIEDDLPKIGTVVVAAYNLSFDDIGLEHYEPEFDYQIWIRNDWDTIASLKGQWLTHWMPLTPPPK